MTTEIINYTGQDVLESGSYVISLEYDWEASNYAAVGKFFSALPQMVDSGIISPEGAGEKSREYVQNMVNDAVASLRTKLNCGDAVEIKSTSIDWENVSMGQVSLSLPKRINIEIEAHSFLVVALIVGAFVACFFLFPEARKIIIRAVGDIIGFLADGANKVIGDPLNTLAIGAVVIAAFYFLLQD